MSETSKTPDSRVSFDEFKLFYESAEKVTDRRLETNRWNYTICLAILTAISALFGTVLTSPNFLVAGIFISILLSIMAILFCSLWVRQIQDFKLLNNAKFTILNAMAPRLVFGESASDRRASFCPFEKEWEKLKELKAVQRMWDVNVVALDSSNTEYLIPHTFRILFILTFAFAVIVLIVNWSLVIAGPFQITP